MAQLYAITWQDKTYIGEFTNDKTNHVYEHVSHAVSWLNNSPSGWEYEMADYARDHGWNQVFRKMPFCASVSLNTAKTTIIKKLKDICFNGDEEQAKGFYNDLFGAVSFSLAGAADDELLFVEMLLICANAYHRDAWNKHSNLNNQGGYFNQSRVINTFSEKKFAAYADRVGSYIPAIYLNFKALKDFDTKLKKYLKLRYRREGTVNIIQEREFIDFVKPAVSAQTKQHVLEQLERYKQKLSKVHKDGVHEALVKLDSIINELEGKQFKTYDEITRWIDKVFDGSQGVHTFLIGSMGKDVAKHMNETLMAFFEHFDPLVDLFTHSDKIKKDAMKKTRRSFSNKIQSIIDDVISYDKEYSLAQHSLFKGNAYLPITHWPGTEGLSKEEREQLSIMKQIWSAFDKGLKTPYIEEHWTYGNHGKSIYSEQITIWLKQKGKDTFYYDQYFKNKGYFEGGNISRSNIKFY